MGIFFMTRVIEMLSQGKFFKSVCSSALNVMAGLTCIGGLVTWIAFWSLFSRSRGFEVLALLIHQCIFVVYIYMLTHTLFIRANDIKQLPEGDFVILPIISRLFRLAGDLCGCVFAYLGVTGFLSTVAGLGLMRSFPMMNMLMGIGGGRMGALALVSGVCVLAAFLIVGFLLMLFFYLSSETTLLLADIAINIKKMRTNMESQPSAIRPPSPAVSFAMPAGSVPAPQPAAPAQLMCPNCSNPVSESTVFCRECGHKIK